MHKEVSEEDFVFLNYILAERIPEDAIIRALSVPPVARILDAAIFIDRLRQEIDSGLRRGYIHFSAIDAAKKIYDAANMPPKRRSYGRFRSIAKKSH